MARKRSRSRASRRKRKQQSVTDEALPIFGVIFGVAIVLGHLDANSLMLVLLAAASLCVFRLWLLRKRREAAQFRARTLDELLALSPRQFEFAIADLLGHLGYTRIRVTGGSGDLGADIVCRAPDGRSVIAQCKRNAPHNKVGGPVLQGFLGMCVHHRAGGIVVTTSSFTLQARDIAAHHSIALIDGESLTAQMLRLNGGATSASVPAGGWYRRAV